MLKQDRARMVAFTQHTIGMMMELVARKYHISIPRELWIYAFFFLFLITTINTDPYFMAVYCAARCVCVLCDGLTHESGQDAAAPSGKSRRIQSAF